MFEIMMAKRYITKQKRHSLLTACSIASALALITMLFCSFFTVMSCARDIAYAEKPYHLQISNLNADELLTAREYMESKAGKPDIFVMENEDGLFTARVNFTEYIGESMFKDPGYLPDLMFRLRGGYANDDCNETLVRLDLIDLDGRANLAVTFSLFYIFANFFIVMLRLIIDTAFEISSRERERQFGVLQSVGATPSQIVKTITAEGLMLSAIGVPAGIVIGIGLAYAAYRAVANTGFLFTPQQMEHVHFHINPLFVLISAVTGLGWVWLSAYGTGKRVIKMPPVEAIKGRGNTVEKVRRRSLFGALFGWKGKMASRNNFRQAKRFIVTVLSLTLSITFFSCIGIIGGFGDMVLLETSDDAGAYFERLYERVYDFTIFINDGDSYRDKLEKIEKSPYFKNVSLIKSNMHVQESKAVPDTGYWVQLVYMNKGAYEEFFEGAPPVSYDELSKSGGHLLMVPEDEHFFDDIPKDILDGDTLHYSHEHTTVYTAEEYANLSDEIKEAENIVPDYVRNGTDESRSQNRYFGTVTAEGDMKIIARASGKAASEDMAYYSQIILVGALETFDEYWERFGWFYGYDSIDCDLSDEKYYEDAIEFIRSAQGLEMQANNLADIRKYEAKRSALHIAIVFLTAVIAVIAAVNMINIISTGILNRKSELASMQSIGMTGGQLYGMTVLECLQYALAAGIFSSALTFFMTRATEKFIVTMGVADWAAEMFFSYSGMMTRVWLSSLAAFVIALVSSLIPLAAMQKKPLVDMIRKIE